MIRTTIVGFPHIGENRQLKTILEDHFSRKTGGEALAEKAGELKKHHWRAVKGRQIDLIPSNDFSLYDRVLDTAVMLNIVPERFRREEFDELQCYFAMARGYQERGIDLKALDMKKWFTTNYHYVVPEYEEGMDIRLVRNRAVEEYNRALALGITTRPALIGPCTFCALLGGFSAAADNSATEKITDAYVEILRGLDRVRCEWVQFDEPCLVMDMDDTKRAFFRKMYSSLLAGKGGCKVLLQTCFGDIRDIYQEVISLPFDAVGLDFIDGAFNRELIAKYGFPADRLLFAGIVNGHNVWVNDYRHSLELLTALTGHIRRDQIVLTTSCSLLHVPFTTLNEKNMQHRFRRHLAFALEKLDELRALAFLFEQERYEDHTLYKENQGIIHAKYRDELYDSNEIRERIRKLTDNDVRRTPPFNERSEIQAAALSLPLFPSSTIGSFPQTAEVRKIRNDFRNGRITEDEYKARIKELIRELIALQERIGLDVLVHGEFERNDMVEYFGEHFAGFVHTENGWVQSYGSRCVKPPVIFGDVWRESPVTVEWITYAQGLTSKPVKGILTGPVTILNWSFPREDIPPAEIAFQIALAIREEVLDLEKAGIRIIQIDEAALREKLPLRKSDWHSHYLDWAVKAYKLTCSGVRPETQIQTHMCYSEFADIMDSIMEMDADVILIEAAKSNLSILEAFRRAGYPGNVGPGVYDIHSPRVPGEEEIVSSLKRMNSIIPAERLWINPDCGLKTRRFEETVPSLTNMVRAAKRMRAEAAAPGRG